MRKQRTSQRSLKHCIRFIAALFLMTFLAQEAVMKTSASSRPTATPTTRTMYVGPNEINCLGEHRPPCLQIKEHLHERWSLLNTPIGGFVLESGFEYELIVSETIAKDEFRHRPVRHLEMVEVVSKSVAMPLEDTVWRLVSHGSIELPRPVIAGRKSTLIFDSVLKFVGGDGGCNRFGSHATYTVGWRSLTTPTEYAVTAMYCFDENEIDQYRFGPAQAARHQFLEKNIWSYQQNLSVRYQEWQFISGVAAAHSYEIWNDELRIFYPEHQMLILVADPVQ